MVRIGPHRHIASNKTKHAPNTNYFIAGKNNYFTISSVEYNNPVGVKQEQMKMPESTHIPINGEPVGPIINGISSGLVSPPTSAPVLSRQPQPTALEERKSPLTSTMTMQVRRRRKKVVKINCLTLTKFSLRDSYPMLWNAESMRNYFIS